MTVDILVNYLFVALWIPIPRKLKNRTIAVARVLPYGIWKTTRTSLELLMAQPRFWISVKKAIVGECKHSNVDLASIFVFPVLPRLLR